MSSRDMRHSKTDVTGYSNIVSLENANEVNEHIFQKTAKKGKLYRGPNWTAYNKENLGSIPRNIEKSLVDDRKSNTKIGFSTQSERFFPKPTSSKNNPGPGSYNINGDLDFTRTSSSFSSSKGFGNGFISSSDRFDSTKLYYNKYTPGPGEYFPESHKNLEHDITKSMLSKSLYMNNKTQSLQIKRQTPGPGYYNPISNTFDCMFRNSGSIKENSMFKSTVTRFAKLKGNTNPGPGKYFKDEFYVDYNDKNKGQSQSFFFRNPVPRRIDEDTRLERYDIKTKQMKDDVKFRLKDKRGRIVSNIKASVEVDFLKTAKSGVSGNPFAMTKKDLFKLRNRTFVKDRICDKKEKPGMMLINGRGGNEQEIEYIGKVLKRQEKPDLFELNRPRWKKNELEFKVPGPAYYHPRLPQKMLSFNRNNVDFMWTPGVINEDYEDPVCNE